MERVIGRPEAKSLTQLPCAVNLTPQRRSRRCKTHRYLPVTVIVLSQQSEQGRATDDEWKIPGLVCVVLLNIGPGSEFLRKFWVVAKGWNEEAFRNESVVLFFSIFQSQIWHFSQTFWGSTRDWLCYVAECPMPGKWKAGSKIPKMFFELTQNWQLSQAKVTLMELTRKAASHCLTQTKIELPTKADHMLQWHQMEIVALLSIHSCCETSTSFMFSVAIQQFIPNTFSPTHEHKVKVSFRLPFLTTN